MPFVFTCPVRNSTYGKLKRKIIILNFVWDGRQQTKFK